MMFMNAGADAGERQPLIKTVAPAFVSKMCFLTVVGALVGVVGASFIRGTAR